MSNAGSIRWGSVKAAELNLLVQKTRTPPNKIISIKGNPPKGLTNEVIEKLLGGFNGTVKQEYVDYLYEYCLSTGQITTKAQKKAEKIEVTQEQRDLLNSEFERTGYSIYKLTKSFGVNNIDPGAFARISDGSKKFVFKSELELILGLYHQIPDKVNNPDMIVLERDLRLLTDKERDWMNEMRDIGLLPGRLFKLVDIDEEGLSEYTVSRWLSSAEMRGRGDHIEKVVSASQEIIQGLYKKRP